MLFLGPMHSLPQEDRTALRRWITMVYTGSSTQAHGQQPRSTAPDSSTQAQGQQSALSVRNVADQAARRRLTNE